MAEKYDELAVCYECVEDEYLKNIVIETGEPLECSVCHGLDKSAISIEGLGRLMEPILREHFSLGQEVKRFGANDSEWWEQEGESLSWVVQEVLGQYFDFEDEIVEAVIDAEDVWPPDGEEAFFDNTSNYVESRVKLSHYYAEWDNLLSELKHKRRFFSPTAQEFFGHLFDGVETLQCWNKDLKSFESVMLEMPQGAEFFRARICSTRNDLTEIFNNPYTYVGPPPKHLARAGRMNAEGVVVFYGATNTETCLAEMRPALGGDAAVIALQTSRPIRLLDFTRLESARHGNALSYFQPDFTIQVERREFLHRLHWLISQPIVPGREPDYLITQTMAEYLAHVHQEPFDGIVFKSVQRAGGVNIVIFPEKDMLADDPEAFPLKYVEGSVKLFTTRSIEYDHHEKHVTVIDGEAYIHQDHDDFDDELF